MNHKWVRHILIFIFLLSSTLLSGCNNGKSNTNEAAPVINNLAAKSATTTSTSVANYIFIASRRYGKIYTYKITSNNMTPLAVNTTNVGQYFVSPWGINQLVVSPNNSKLYILNSEISQIKVCNISPSDGFLSGCIDVGQLGFSPEYMVISPDNKYAYIKSNGNGQYGYSVKMFAIDQSNGTLTQIAEANNNSQPIYGRTALAIDSSGSFLTLTYNTGFAVYRTSTNSPSIDYVTQQYGNFGMALSGNTSMPVFYTYTTANETASSLGQLIQPFSVQSDGGISSLPSYSQSFYPLDFDDNCLHSGYSCNSYMTVAPDNSKLLFVTNEGNLNMVGLNKNNGSFIENSAQVLSTQSFGQYFPRSVIIEGSSQYAYILAANSDITQKGVKLYIAKLNNNGSAQLTIVNSIDTVLPNTYDVSNFVKYACSQCSGSNCPMIACPAADEWVPTLMYSYTMAQTNYSNILLTQPTNINNIVLNQPFTISFGNYLVDSATVNSSTVQLSAYINNTWSNIAWTDSIGTWSEATNEFTFKPKTALPYDTILKLTVNGVKSNQGYALPSQTFNNITTRSPEQPLFTYPYSGSTIPYQAMAVEFIVQFGSLVDKTQTLQDKICLNTVADPTNQWCNVYDATSAFWNGNDFHFRLNQSLGAYTAYNIDLNNIIDTDGGIETNNSSEFTTMGSPTGEPQLIEPNSSQQSDMRLDQPFTLSFDGIPVDKSTVNSTTVQLIADNNSVVPWTGTPTWSGNNVTFNPQKLSYNTKYTLVINGVKYNSSGNYTNMPEVVFNGFQSHEQTKPELIEPQILTAVQTTSEFALQFGEFVNKSGIENKIWISPSIASYTRIYPNAATMNWVGNTLYFTPGDSLKSEMSYILHTAGINDIDGGNEIDSTTMFNTITSNEVQLISPRNKYNTSLRPIIVVRYSNQLNPNIDPVNSIKVSLTNGDPTPVPYKTIYDLNSNTTQSMMESYAESLFTNQQYKIDVNVTDTSNNQIEQSFFIYTQESPNGKKNAIKQMIPTIANYRQKNANEDDLLVFYTISVDGITMGFDGNFGGSQGADAICNNTFIKPPPEACHGSCTYKALIGWDDGMGNGRYACDNNGCGTGHSQDWILQPNQKYSVFLRNTDAEDYPNSKPYYIRPFATTNFDAIFEGRLKSHLISWPNMFIWTGLTTQWTAGASTNTCGGLWNATKDNNGQALTGQLGNPSTLLVSQLINHSTTNCAHLDIFQDGQAIGTNKRWHYGFMCVEQP